MAASTREAEPPDRPLGLRIALVLAATGSQRLADIERDLMESFGGVTESQWQAEVRTAIDFGLIRLSGSTPEQTVTRTEFGDSWAATLDSADSQPSRDRRWPLPGPGRFDVAFFPLTRRPDFAVFALTGPAVAAIRQGAWNLRHGNGKPGPNPVTQVEMLSVLHGGSTFSVWSTVEDPMIGGLQLSRPVNARAIVERTLSALNSHSSPWVARAAEVDGAPREILALDLASDDLPQGIVGPPLMAVAELEGTTVTIIGPDPDSELTLTRVDPEHLLGPTGGEAARQ